MAVPLVYSDDKAILSRTPNDHIVLVRLVSTIIHDGALTLNFSKCKFFTNLIDYLGLVIYSGRFEATT